jgi:hypothetical protein
MSDGEDCESDPEVENRGYETGFFCQFNEVLTSIRNALVPYKKKLTNFGCTGKHQTSVILYSEVNTARPQFDIFPYSPPSQSLSY